MTNISSLPGPPNGDDDIRPGQLDATFDWAAQLAQSQSGRVAHEIAQALETMLRIGPQTTQVHAMQSGIQSLYSGVMRLAICPEVRPLDIEALSGMLPRLSAAGRDRVATEQHAGQVQGILTQIAPPAGHGAMFALNHCKAMARQVRDDAASVQLAGPSRGISVAAGRTLALATHLADPMRRGKAPDAQIAGLLQGMAATLHAVASHITDGGSQVNLAQPVRELVTAMDGASHTHLSLELLALRCKQVMGQTGTFAGMLARYPLLMSSANLAVYALEADAAALGSAVRNLETRRPTGFEGA